MACHMDHSNYKNNGLITKVWGKEGWDFNHAVTYGYPLEPSDEQKTKYRNYFISLGDVLPCSYCQDSYKKFITTGETALTDDVLENRESLTRWFKRVHDAVNNKLGVEYAIDYEDLDDRYEKFRATCGKQNNSDKGCTVPLNEKALVFRKMYYQDAPIVSLVLVEPFIKMAKIRGLDADFFVFIELAKLLDGNFDKLKKQECWTDRNNYCCDLIKYMRINAIPSVEEEGQWQGTPTMDELKLLMYLSSNLNRSELNQARKATINALHKLD